MEYRYDDDSDDDVDADGDTPMSDDDGYDSGYASGENSLDDSHMVDMCDPMDADEDMDMMEDPIAVYQPYTSPEEDRYHCYLQQQQLENQRQREQQMQCGPHQQGFQQQYIQPQQLQYEQQRQQQRPFQQVHSFQQLQPCQPIQPVQQPQRNHPAIGDFKLDNQAIADFKLEPNHRKFSLPPAREQATPVSEKQRTVSEGTSVQIQSQIATERLGVKHREKLLNISNVWRTWQDMQLAAEIQGIADETLTAAIDDDFNFGGEEGGKGHNSADDEDDRNRDGNAHTEDEGLITTATTAGLISSAKGRGRKGGFHVSEID
ncbi:MAG: hypothetical protein Q9192_008051 [Flavoplaca navasiana]